MPKIPRPPLSPHLQIYDLPFTARLSIFHRATGVILSLGLFLIPLGLLALWWGPAAWRLFHSLMASIPGKLFLLGLTFSLYFHACNGVRHLFWDAGMGFSLKRSRYSGIAVLVVSGLLTGVTWLLAMQAGGEA